MRPLAALLLLLAAGCSPVLVGTGNVDQLQGAYAVCKWETIGYAFIPDLGATDTIMRNRCMREFGWAPASGTLMGWSWVGRP